MTKAEKIEIQRREITKVMNYFENHKLDFQNDRLLAAMQNSITRIFQLDIEELGYTYDPKNPDDKNTFDLEFVNDSAKHYRGAHQSGFNLENGKLTKNKPKIVYNAAHMYKDLDSNDKDTRLSACKTLFKTVFHEIQHHRQVLMARTNVSSKEGMLYARDFAIRSYLDEKWYTRNKETGNYERYAIENNANETGYREYLEIMGSDDEISNLRDIEER